jgi:LacI family transcriptional regulator
MASLLDLARAAGVSTSTASRALNRPEMLSEAVVSRVRSLAAELGYTGNPFARALRVQESKTLGLIVPDSTDPFFAEVARGIEAACFRAGYTLILCNSDRSLEKEAAQARVLAEQRVDGVLLFNASDASAPTVEWLQQNGVPLVLVERRLAGTAVDCVISDNRGGVRSGVAHLAAYGHRRIGCLVADLGANHYADRLEAYREAVTALGLDVDETLIRSDLVTYADGLSGAQELLGIARPPTALFCMSDTLAIGALRGAALAGKRIPDDVSVVGFGSTEVTGFTNPPLTSVGQQRVAVGAMAVRVLLRQRPPRPVPDRPSAERVAPERPKPETHIVPTQLIVRESTGAAAVIAGTA